MRGILKLFWMMKKRGENIWVGFRVVLVYLGVF
jgi:hypothetical protein